MSLQNWNGSAYETVRIEPEFNDLKYHRTFKFQEVTFRGTVEFRSCCCQPVVDSMTVAAFHVGLSEVLCELKVLLDNEMVLSGNGLTVSELRKTFCRGERPDFVDEEKLQLIDSAAVFQWLLTHCHTGRYAVFGRTFPLSETAGGLCQQQVLAFG